MSFGPGKFPFWCKGVLHLGRSCPGGEMRKKEFILTTTRWLIEYGEDAGREHAISAALRGRSVMAAEMDGAWFTKQLYTQVDQRAMEAERHRNALKKIATHNSNNPIAVCLQDIAIKALEEK